ncbi:DUF1592 domain-containing protein [Synoicihabitans lomoniglobus]|uniref:DUF1592 domain-containing protein n=1 Tax=Synoicihabitans lomoniglobus TaxID=2909285 RepID=A0AAE9ZSS2_9BACT|nr:DUF1592 domain-containing protein [Opitutaceae bacterium LMO-M01]WED63492.1 DUF1592 domain-containing protein [Opitutaceae bacterium LMO-M01]
MPLLPVLLPQSATRNPRALARRLLSGLIVAASMGAIEVSAQMRAEIVPSFVEAHCVRCHNATDLEGGLDLEAFRFQADDPDNFSRWVKMHDRVEAGEMPPASNSKRRHVAPEDRSAFVRSLADILTDAEKSRVAREGRAVQRRLNRYEYENALRDLLNLPWVRLKDRLPPDGEAHRFNKVGTALDVSHVQMARYLSSADYALRQALSQRFAGQSTTTQRYYARDEPSLVRNFWPRQGSTLTDRHAFPVLDGHAQPEVRAGRAPITESSTREREAVGKISSTFSDAGGYRWSKFRAPVGGHYTLRFKGYTLWASGGGVSRWFFNGVGDAKTPVYWLPLWHRPNLDEIWPGRRAEPIGVFGQSGGQGRFLGTFDFGPEPGVHEINVVLQPNEVIQTDGSRLFRTRVNGTNEQYINPLAQPDGMPGYAVQWMEVEGPFEDPASPESGYAVLFEDLPLREIAAGKSAVTLSVVATEAVENGDRPGWGTPAPVDVAVEVVSNDPTADARRLLRSFLDRAYRRPANPDHYEQFVGLFERQYGLGYGFAQSMISAYTAVLASPGFLFVEEAPGLLDDYAIATRLALFLWNSTPDAELRALAADGQLRDPEVLRTQTNRLIDDPRSRRFVDAFTDYWLDLRKFDDTSPSATLYNDYELDDPLKQASIFETQLFVQELLRADLPARNVVDSEFTFLNERLAAHYDVPGIAGAKMRKVTLPAESVRGGLLTQASVLKVTANGTTTSPVIRGNWITERILGYQTPPPPPVPAVEPDIRGAVTIRQQLEKHRADASCASCHARMDPPGFALESFDVMGGWRDRYRAIDEQVEAIEGLGMNGQKFAYHFGLPVDSAGELPDGSPFADVTDFKALLLQHEETIARNLARQLTIYATGAPVLFSDRPSIESILQRAAAHDYGMRTLVHEIVQSDLFQSK